MKRLVSSLTLCSVAFSAAPAFAADLKTEILENMVKVSEPAMDVIRPAGTGGGGTSFANERAGGMTMPAPSMDAKMSIYPYPQQNGVTVDVSVVKEVRPDIVIASVWCNETSPSSRSDVRAKLNTLFQKIRERVGKDGRVRRGSPSLNSWYDPASGRPSTSYTGSISITIRFARPEASSSIVSWIEDTYDCSVSWDVRMSDPQSYELGVIDELVTKLEARKKVFEKLLNKKLTDVSTAYLSTYVDGYNGFDPDTGMADATTTLSVTFVVPGKTVIKPMPTTR